MAKMSYADQLKHPSWQRKRLEVLEAYGFKCATCGSDDKTLHVHHKHYVKGRKAWEYELSELVSLCEACHDGAHESKASIDAVLAEIPSETWPVAASFLAGFCYEYLAPATSERAAIDKQAALSGEIAWRLALYLGDDEVREVSDAFSQLGPEGFLKALRDAVARELGA